MRHRNGQLAVLPATRPGEEQHADGSCHTPVKGVVSESGVLQEARWPRHIRSTRKPDRPPGLKTTFPAAPRRAPPLRLAPMLMKLHQVFCANLKHGRHDLVLSADATNKLAGGAASPRDEAQGQSRQSRGCPTRADGTCACDTHTPGDAAGPCRCCFYYRGLFRGSLCAERWLSRWSEGRRIDITSEEKRTLVPFSLK